MLAPVDGYHSSFFFSATPDAPGYPELRVETGGGMAASYHRRILMRWRDMAAESVVVLGSNSVQLGYYMAHGGQNPVANTTMQEWQGQPNNEGYNDMPVYVQAVTELAPPRRAR